MGDPAKTLKTVTREELIEHYGIVADDAIDPDETPDEIEIIETGLPALGEEE